MAERVAWLLCLLGLLVSLAGCPRQATAGDVAATVVAHATNAASTSLLEAERYEAELAVDRADDAAEARAALRAVRERWDRVWAAYDALRVAHDAYREGAELAAVLAAYCRLAELAVRYRVAMPQEVCRAAE